MIETFKNSELLNLNNPFKKTNKLQIVHHPCFFGCFNLSLFLSKKKHSQRLCRPLQTLHSQLFGKARETKTKGPTFRLKHSIGSGIHGDTFSRGLSGHHLKRCPKNRRNPKPSPRDKRYLSIFRGPIFPCNGWFLWWTPFLDIQKIPPEVERC